MKRLREEKRAKKEKEKMFSDRKLREWKGMEAKREEDEY